MTEDTYNKLTNAYIWIIALGGLSFFGWYLWATKAPEAGWLYDLPLFQALGVAGGWIALLTLAIYWLTYRRFRFGR
jgi:hypothetical protein